MRRAKGISLLELVIVMLILAAAAALSHPSPVF
jgi:prepilin-type N-terminal cleavage/methylation domain-containing protein